MICHFHLQIMTTNKLYFLSLYEKKTNMVIDYRAAIKYK